MCGHCLYSPMQITEHPCKTCYSKQTDTYNNFYRIEIAVHKIHRLESELSAAKEEIERLRMAMNK